MKIQKTEALKNWSMEGC